MKYAFVDICSSVGELKKFLKIRDTADEYREIREEKHNVGIPCLVVDDKIFALDSKEMAESIIEEYGLANTL